MALALAIKKGSDDYVLVEHHGERIRIAAHDRPGGPGSVVIALMADEDSGRSPDQSWRLLRKKVREREGGT